MKHTKRLLAILIAALILAVSAAPALAAYTPVTITGNPAQTDTNATSLEAVTHRMTLTADGVDYLPYAITYTFTVGDAAVEYPSNVVDAADLVTGKPVITAVTYPAGTTFTDKDSNNKYYKENTLAIDWSGVSIKQPGIYTWSVSETASPSTIAGENVSQNLQNGTLKVWAVDNNGTLELGGWFFLNASNKGDIHDTFPATTADLSMAKTVSGALGSKEEYFKFTVTLTTPAGAASKAYSITGFDPATTVNDSGYNSGAVQPANTITLVGGTASSFDVWLKHGQTVTVKDLPYNTTYTIIEPEHTHYRANGEIKNAKELVADITETINNISEETPPTGIALQMAAPLFGIVLAGLLMAVVLFSKRRENH